MIPPDDLTDSAEIEADGIEGDDGIDLGWVTSSGAVMTVKHIFSGVSNGDNYSVSGPDSTKGSGKPLTMDRKDEDTADTDENAAYRPGIHIAGNDDLELTVADATDPNPSACVEEGTYAETIGGNHRPG